jgi:hypothetical protein
LKLLRMLEQGYPAHAQSSSISNAPWHAGYVLYEL